MLTLLRHSSLAAAPWLVCYPSTVDHVPREDAVCARSLLVVGITLAHLGDTTTLPGLIVSPLSLSLFIEGSWWVLRWSDCVIVVGFINSFLFWKVALDAVKVCP